MDYDKLIETIKANIVIERQEERKQYNDISQAIYCTNNTIAILLNVLKEALPTIPINNVPLGGVIVPEFPYYTEYIPTEDPETILRGESRLGRRIKELAVLNRINNIKEANTGNGWSTLIDIYKNSFVFEIIDIVTADAEHIELIKSIEQHVKLINDFMYVVRISMNPVLRLVKYKSDFFTVSQHDNSIVIHFRHIGENHDVIVYENDKTIYLKDYLLEELDAIKSFYQTITGLDIDVIANNDYSLQHNDDGTTSSAYIATELTDYVTKEALSFFDLIFSYKGSYRNICFKLTNDYTVKFGDNSTTAHFYIGKDNVSIRFYKDFNYKYLISIYIQPVGFISDSSVPLLQFNIDASTGEVLNITINNKINNLIIGHLLSHYKQLIEVAGELALISE